MKVRKVSGGARKNSKRIVAVSGGFDPIHVGHIRMIAEAKELAGPGGELVVIVNNDHWLRAKKVLYLCQLVNVRRLYVI